MQLITR